MNEQTSITLSLTIAQVNTIATALAERPYREVVDLMTKLMQQAQAEVDRLKVPEVAPTVAPVAPVEQVPA